MESKRGLIFLFLALTLALAIVTEASKIHDISGLISQVNPYRCGLTIKNSYQFMRIDHLMDQLNREYVFSNISPKTRYLHVRVDTCDI
ncbi:transmembrane protein, putative [Medicago truncatula]|uniref:Transmembrane protein, putative n=1 Tax=Medicago truncatula TaxID=3880 RepID=G7ISB3_MEDTR|nr:transmembrane protein, putative [Medicago truncatula]